MDKLDLYYLLLKAEDLYYNSSNIENKNIAIKFIKSYICYFHKDNINLFLEESEEFKEFIEDIKEELNNCPICNLNELCDVIRKL